MNKNVKSWRCRVCGYVHQGDKPTAPCPVCGAPADAFEPYDEAPPTSLKSVPASYRCIVCGYVHNGGEPPDTCPVCNTSRDSFEAVDAEVSKNIEIKGSRVNKVVIIGAGTAGLSASEAIRDINPDVSIDLVSIENTLPYYRLNLTRYLAGEIGDADLPIHPEKWYKDKNINLMLGSEVASIDPDNRTVALTDGRSLEYDKLIVSSGAHSFIPPVPGVEFDNVTGVRSDEDARSVLQLVENTKKVVIVGGGILGLETAGALLKRGKEVSIIEGFPWLMPRQLNKSAGKLFQKYIESIGIKLYLDTQVKEIAGSHKAEKLLLKNGIVIEADVILISAGVRSNTYLARQAGIEVNNGIVVNNYLQTSHEDIYAAGDVAEHRGICYGIWPASQYMGKFAGMNVMGVKTEFGGIPMSNTLKVLDVNVTSIGRFNRDDGNDIIIEKTDGTHYVRLLFRDNRLRGAVMIGDTSLTSSAREAIEHGTDFSNVLKKGMTIDEIKSIMPG